MQHSWRRFFLFLLFSSSVGIIKLRGGPIDTEKAPDYHARHRFSTTGNRLVIVSSLLDRTGELSVQK